MKALVVEDRISVHQFLKERFTLSELKDLAFFLGVDCELFEFKEVSDLAREMVMYFERRGRESCLIQEMMKQRPNLAEMLRGVLAYLQPCQPTAKVQLFLAESTISNFDVLKESLAKVLGIQKQEIELIAAAWGSSRLLLQIPTSALDFTRFSKISFLANGEYHVLSIQDFVFLDRSTQQIWRLVATTYPPVYQQKALYPTVSWAAVENLDDEAQKTATMVAKIRAVVPGHWLTQTINIETIYTLSRKIVDKLAPGNLKQLNAIFPRYLELAQTGRVQSAQQAAQAFGFAEGADPTVLLIISVLVTAFNSWLIQKNSQTLADMKKQADWETVRKLLEEAIRATPISSQQSGRVQFVLDEVVRMELGDVYTPYEIGLKHLREEIGVNLELLTYEQRLRDNIFKARRYGDDEGYRAERNGIVEQLNRLALTTLGLPFNDMLGPLKHMPREEPIGLPSEQEKKSMDVVPYLPIILEATKFLFGELRQRLEDSRQSAKEAPAPSAHDISDKNVFKISQQDLVAFERNPQDLGSLINTHAAETNAYVIKGLVEQLQIHLKNINDLERVQAQYGLLTPQHVKHGIEYEAKEIAEKSERLKHFLTIVYGRPIEGPNA